MPQAVPDLSNLLRQDIRCLGKALGEVIRDSEGKATLTLIEALRRAAVSFRREHDPQHARILEKDIPKLNDAQARSVARAFAYFLHLSNIAEDRDQNRRREEQDPEKLLGRSEEHTSELQSRENL